MSPPAQKAGGLPSRPAPSTATAWISGRAAQCLSSVVRSRIMASDSAFSACGRFSVMRPRQPLISAWIWPSDTRGGRRSFMRSSGRMGRREAPGLHGPPAQQAQGYRRSGPHGPGVRPRTTRPRARPTGSRPGPTGPVRGWAARAPGARPAGKAGPVETRPDPRAGPGHGHRRAAARPAATWPPCTAAPPATRRAACRRRGRPFAAGTSSSPRPGARRVPPPRPPAGRRAAHRTSIRCPCPPRRWPTRCVSERAAPKRRARTPL
mmetsp:Transcript_59273/g.139928  ORF Transcript_59273/g.139928 Transcript_59273/m.139928 type:complete len:264 (+) Transcript_59273:872-1663(+)